MTLIIDPATGRPFGEPDPSPLEAMGLTEDRLRGMLADCVARGDAGGAPDKRESDPVVYHAHELLRAALDSGDLVAGASVAYVLILHEAGLGGEILAGLVALAAGVWRPFETPPPAGG